MRCHLMIVCLLVPSLLVGCGPAPSGPARVYHRQDGGVTTVQPSRDSMTGGYSQQTTRYGSKQEYQNAKGNEVLLLLAVHVAIGLIQLTADAISPNTPDEPSR